MIKKLILILSFLVVLDYIAKRNSNAVFKKTTKYEYNGKYKDPHKERIVEHIGE